jgi:Ner family transcriptional regulator
MIYFIKMKKDGPKNSKNLRALLKFTLSMKDLAIAELARAHTMSTSNLCNAFYIPYPKGEAIIAAALGLQPWELWPSWYGEDHRSDRKRGRRQRQDNMKTCEVKEKNEAGE